MYKKRLSIGLATLLVVLAFPGFVFAESEEISQSSTNITTESTSESTSEDRVERVKEYKAKAVEKLSSTQEKKVAGVCKNSQQKLEKVQTTVGEVALKRQEKLSLIQQKLKDLSLRLQKASIDTTELDGLILNLEQKTTDFMAEFTIYQQMIEDSATIDCETDPKGFKASLEAARDKRGELKDASAEIKSYVKDSIKPILEQIKASLQQPTAESEN